MSTKMGLPGITLLVLIASVAWGQQHAPDNRGYYRYPTIHGAAVVFVAEGDLWRVGVEGGLAARLTTHPAQEVMPAFSPDGKTIAFAASYEGPREVYTMPATGGLPARRTFDGATAAVAGWTPAGKILYATERFSALPVNAELRTIDASNKTETVPLSQAAQGAFDDKGETLFFTRLQWQSSSTKRYQGGEAENIWKYVQGHEAVPLTASYAGTSRNPMWWRGRIYFVSDRDGTANLWSMDESGKALKQHTKHHGFDVQSASLSEGRIVYDMAGDLHVLDIATGADRLMPVQLPSDFDNLREHWVKGPMDYATSIHLSPDGNSLAVTARGRLFVIPAKQGRLVDISTQRPGRFREGRLMPNGKSVITISTESGETEVWRYASNGEGPAEQLTKGAGVLRWEGRPSPDGKLIAHQDKDQKLWIYDIGAKSDKKIAEMNDGDIDEPSFGSLAWSPDSQWLTWAQDAPNYFTQVKLYNVKTGHTEALTTDRYNSGAASWSPDGKWIYLLSDRSLTTVVAAPWGSRQPDPYFDKSYKIYALSLKKDVRSRFEPEDELHPADVVKPPDAAKPDAAKAVIPNVEIDDAGILGRLQEVPVPPGNYSDLAVAGDRLCWIAHDPETPNNAHDTLQCVDINNKLDNKPQTLLDGVKQFEVAADGKNMLVRKGNDLFVLDGKTTEASLKDPKALADAQVDLKSWTFSVVPQAEFREEFLDSWRLHRDYFYDPQMHHVDWTAMRDKYLPLVDRVRDRVELSEVLSQMVGELSALHTFVVGGDVRKGADQVQVATLGARLIRDDTAPGFRIEHIYQTDPDKPDKLSPLLRQGVGVSEGDIITAINGQSAVAVADAGELLRDQVGRQLLLTWKRAGQTELRHAVVRAISVRDEDDMRYSEWEYTRRLAVERASSGHMGYVHLRAMGAFDIARWIEGYTPVFDREGLIVDVRHNFGGNIDSWVLDRLSRKAWMYWQARRGPATWNMQEAFRGHVVVLCDEVTASDGEAFAEGFRRLGLGKVIGTRTWGGEIWLSFSNQLADNGIASAAENGVFADGKWLIEGHGVDPDMVVDDLPHAAFEGKDAQLEAAIAYLAQEIAKNPNPLPDHPAYPDKSEHMR